MCRKKQNGLREALNQKLVDNLSEVAELRGQLKASLQSLNERIDRLLALEKKVSKNSVEIVRLKTVWTAAAAFIALLSSFAKQIFFTHGK